MELYLNPLRAPSAFVPASKSETAAPLPVKTASAVTAAVPVRPPASAPKFELHGISYYRQKPDQSMALVLEPGGTRRWVHPGEQLGHLTIERIDCNSVLCRDGAQTHVVALAANEAIAMYARSVKDTGAVSTPKQAQKKEQGPEVPPPAPGIRQMPLARVAALLGQRRGQRAHDPCIFRVGLQSLAIRQHRLRQMLFDHKPIPLLAKSGRVG